MDPIDTPKRSVVKSIIWRVIGIVLLGGLMWIVTSDWAATTLVTALFHGIRVVMYYYFERGWERVSWGRETAWIMAQTNAIVPEVAHHCPIQCDIE